MSAQQSAKQTAAAQTTLANWMRVQISVRNGKDPSAHARAAARLTPWHDMQPARATGAFSIYAVDFIPEGWAFTDPLQQRVAFSRDTYFTLAHDPDALTAAVTSLGEGVVGKNGPAAGLRRVPLGGAERARRDGDADGSMEIDGEPLVAADRVAQLEADYRALMARLRAASEGEDMRALGEGLSAVRALAARQEQLRKELDRMSGYAEVVQAMVKKLA